jgi:SAM-dependent methyltransferase
MADPDAADYQAIAYELPEIWEDAWFGDDDRERVRHVVTLLPPEATSLLDAGCGNGLFLRALAAASGGRFTRIAGADRSAAALAHVAGEKHLAPIDALPFGDREFDVVTCMEVLEHLPVDAFPRGLAELSRVASKYLLVTVPYKQDLEASLSRCPSCLARFNPDFHVRSFDEGVLNDLFAAHGFAQTQLRYLGRSDVRLHHAVAARLRAMRQPSPTFPAYAVCPVCGYRQVERLQAELESRRQAAAAKPRPSSGVRKLIGAVMPATTRYRWACALYERRS